VLPLRRRPDHSGGHWISGPWVLRSTHLFLIPGDSPIGYRLPLDSLPWSKDDTDPIYEIDPFAPVQPLAPAGQLTAPPPSGRPSTPGAREESTAGVIHTALCVEVRHGRLHVFMPPVRRTEDYVDLIAAIEQTAARLSRPVVVEGTPPEPDPRLEHLKVTPDPGVIEVNLHPAHCWDELV